MHLGDAKDMESFQPKDCMRLLRQIRVDKHNHGLRFANPAGTSVVILVEFWRLMTVRDQWACTWHMLIGPTWGFWNLPVLDYKRRCLLFIFPLLLFSFELFAVPCSGYQHLILSSSFLLLFLSEIFLGGSLLSLVVFVFYASSFPSRLFYYFF